jgi:hypothetical protein
VTFLSSGLTQAGTYTEAAEPVAAHPGDENYAGNHHNAETNPAKTGG